MPILLSNNLKLKQVTLTAPAPSLPPPEPEGPQFELTTEIGDWYVTSSSSGGA